MNQDPTAVVYDERDVRVLDAAFVRVHPGMFIGNLRSDGLHYLLFALVDDAVREARRGHCRNIELVVGCDQTIRLQDDGRSFEPARLAELFTSFHGPDIHRDSQRRGLEGVNGMVGSVINALSEWCRVEIHSTDCIQQMQFARGQVEERWKTLPHLSHEHHGFVVEFKPDVEIFEETRFDFDTIGNRLQELAFLNPGLTLSVCDERNGGHAKYRFHGGLVDFVREFNHGQPTLHPTICFGSSSGEIEVRGAFQYCDSDVIVIRNYVNGESLRDGGTHVTGLWRGLTLGWKACLRGTNDPVNSLVGQDYREGLTAVVQVQHPDPVFQGAARWSVTNPELDPLVAQAVRAAIREFGRRHADLVPRLYRHFTQAADVRRRAMEVRRTLRTATPDA